jgi:hypothetical protein
VLCALNFAENVPDVFTLCYNPGLLWPVMPQLWDSTRFCHVCVFLSEYIQLVYLLPESWRHIYTDLSLLEKLIRRVRHAACHLLFRFSLMHFFFFRKLTKSVEIYLFLWNENFFTVLAKFCHCVFLNYGTLLFPYTFITLWLVVYFIR